MVRPIPYLAFIADHGQVRSFGNVGSEVSYLQA